MGLPGHMSGIYGVSRRVMRAFNPVFIKGPSLKVSRSLNRYISLEKALCSLLLALALA